MDNKNLNFIPKCPQCNKALQSFSIDTNPPHTEYICPDCNYKKIKTGNNIKVELSR